MPDLPPLPGVPALPAIGGAPGQPINPAVAPSAPSDDFPSIDQQSAGQALDALKLRQFRPTENVDPNIWFNEAAPPPQPARQDPDYELGWAGNASLTPAAPSKVPKDTNTLGGSPDLRAAIARIAGEGGIDPSYALATADRESSFNPRAGGTGTISGLFQMSGALRRKYGIPSDADDETQIKGFTAFTRDLRSEMKGVLGRDPTDAETYMGHHFGGVRAARMISGQIDPNTPVTDVFTPRELAGNPHIVRAGTAGNLMRETGTDMSRRMQRYQGQQGDQDFSVFGRGEDEGQDADLAAIGSRYPALGSILKDTVVRQGQRSGPNDDRQLEFYQPWEKESPSPGKPVVELFSDMSPRDRQDAIAADLLHHLGAIDPRSGKPVDPQFYSLKQELGAARTPRHSQIDREAYEQEKASPYGAGEYKDWDENNRLDAYVRGGLFPDQNPEWQGGIITPQMQSIIGRMKGYLTTPAPAEMPPPRPGTEVDLSQFGI